MFDDFLNHRCDIYHAADEPVSVGYGISTGNTQSHSEADEKNVPCHFHIKQVAQINVVQHEPYSTIEGKTKLSLPAETDIRINDKVVDLSNNLEYSVTDVPRTVHGGHHVIAIVEREKGEPNAI